MLVLMAAARNGADYSTIKRTQRKRFSQSTSNAYRYVMSYVTRILRIDVDLDMDFSLVV